MNGLLERYLEHSLSERQKLFSLNPDTTYQAEFPVVSLLSASSGHHLVRYWAQCHHSRNTLCQGLFFLIFVYTGVLLQHMHVPHVQYSTHRSQNKVPDALGLELQL